MLIVARLTHEKKEYIGKREVLMYAGTDIKTKDANVGLTLRNQREMRVAIRIKYGLTHVSSGGSAVVDYSDIPEL
mgnify:CR=1 FL=1